MTSMIFSDEEARFLRLALKLAERPSDNSRASWMMNGLHITEKKAKPAGEFRVLVIGDRGVGKTSLLTKFCTGVFPDPSTLPTSSYSHGCRHTITVGSRLYTVDALELPADHLSSPEQLAQALAITEAAVLVYDVTDATSLNYLKSLAGMVGSALHPHHHTGTPAPTARKRSTFHPFTGSSTRRELPTTTAAAIATTAALARDYHFLLLGAKSDVAPPLREVSWLEGYRAAAEFFGPAGGVAGGASASFMEVSARSGENVGAVFPLLGREVLRSRREREEAGEEECRALLRQQQQQQQQQQRLWQPPRLGNGVGDEGIALAGSVRRRWYALMSALSGGFFKRESGK